MTSNPDIVAQLDGENPLPASIDVNLSEAQSVSDIANRILENETFVKICDNPDDPSDSLQYGQKTVDKLFSLTNAIRYIGIGLIVVLVLIAFIFINNTIRLAILARRKEIAIMRLVGASNGFIRGPFLAEGALHAIIGALSLSESSNSSVSSRFRVSPRHSRGFRSMSSRPRSSSSM